MAVRESDVQATLVLIECLLDATGNGGDTFDECESPDDLCGHHFCHEIGCVADKLSCFKAIVASFGKDEVPRGER